MRSSQPGATTNQVNWYYIATLLSSAICRFLPRRREFRGGEGIPANLWRVLAPEEARLVAGVRDPLRLAGRQRQDPGGRRQALRADQGVTVAARRADRHPGPVRIGWHLLRSRAWADYHGGTKLAEIERRPRVKEHAPALAFAASHLGSNRLRWMATMAGNVCHASR